MNPTIVTKTDSHIVVQITLPAKGSLFDIEDKIYDTLHQAGRLAIAQAIENNDNEADTLQVGGETFYSKGHSNGHYQTASGKISVKRRTYQRAEGGKTICPAEKKRD